MTTTVNLLFRDDNLEATPEFMEYIRQNGVGHAEFDSEHFYDLIVEGDTYYIIGFGPNQECYIMPKYEAVSVSQWAKIPYELALRMNQVYEEEG